MIRPLFRIAALACCALAAARAADTPPRVHVFHREDVLGTSLELRVQTDSEERAAAAEKVALAEIGRLASLLSTWTPDSEISRWLAAPAGPRQVSPDLFAVLSALDRWESRSHGVFNPRVGQLSALWHTAGKRDRLPASDELAAALRPLARPAWRLDAETRTAERLGDAPVTVDALAKGYIIDRAGAAVLAADPTLRGLLINIGGDLRLWGETAREIAIADPRADAENAPPLATASLRSAALATSGNYRRGWTIGGRHYSHILDPRTGLPSDDIASASVIAPDATTADALATIFSILPPAESLRLAGPLDGVEFLLQTRDGRTLVSPGWPHPQPAAGELAALNPLPIGARSDSMELIVGFELPRQPKRPYVAIWLEDQDNFPIRTLLLWIQQDREGLKWLRDLKRWVRSDKLRRVVDDTDLVPVVSSATRRAGHYSVVWDGLDDNKEPVTPGAYTLYIEVVREDGTHQLVKHAFNVGGAAFGTELPGNVELRSVSLDYQPKPAAK